MVKKIKAVIFSMRLKWAIKEARRKAEIYQTRFLVLCFKGKPIVISMDGIRRLVKAGRFSKEFTPTKAQKMALFIANPKDNEFVLDNR